MENKTHLTFADRNRIQGCLTNNQSFKQIAFKLHKSPSTISREIKAHMFVKKSLNIMLDILMIVFFVILVN